jgi:mannose-1-phosphate guanylyltransferase
LATVPRPQLAIEAVVEPEPLGTAGAVAFGRAHLGPAAIVMNGDTFVDCDLDAFATAALSDPTPASLVAVHQENTSRHGQVEVRDGRLIGFQEKLDGRPGLINAGIYLLKQPALTRINEIKSGSIERDFFARLPKGSVMVWQTRGRFVDIGTPGSLATAGDLLGSTS